MNRYLTITLLTILCSTVIVADVIHVPQDQPSIQAGISASVNGDTVLVEDNTYYENISFKGKTIVVASLFIVDGDTNHINNTIIDGSHAIHSDSGSVVYFISGEDTNSVLSGFTITGGKGTSLTLIPPYLEKDGGGILILNSGATIENNKITNNHISAAGDTFTAAAGITAIGDTGNFIIIRENEISYNTTVNTGNGQAAGPVAISTKEKCLFEKNWIHHNECDAVNSTSFAGGLFIDGSLDHPGPYLIQNNKINNNTLNTVASGGGGIFIQNSSPVLTNNIISENIASQGGGIWITHWTYAATAPPKPILVNNTIINNSSTGNGNGILIGGTSQAEAIVLNTILWGNSGSTSAQITKNNGADISVRYSIVQEGYSGVGNIDKDPLLEADSLTYKSPAIGSGTLGYDFGGGIVLGCPSCDINGRERPYPADSGPDIGAWESKLSSPVTGIKSQTVTEIPERYTLFQNYPNPFNHKTIIRYDLPKHSNVRITILNSLGQEIETLVNVYKYAGSHTTAWDATNYGSGIYFYKISTDDFTQIRKCVLMK